METSLNCFLNSYYISLYKFIILFLITCFFLFISLQLFFLHRSLPFFTLSIILFCQILMKFFKIVFFQHRTFVVPTLFYGLVFFIFAAMQFTISPFFHPRLFVLILFLPISLSLLAFSFQYIPIALMHLLDQSILLFISFIYSSSQLSSNPISPSHFSIPPIHRFLAFVWFYHILRPFLSSVYFGFSSTSSKFLYFLIFFYLIHRVMLLHPYLQSLVILLFTQVPPHLPFYVTVYVTLVYPYLPCLLLFCYFYSSFNSFFCSKLR